MADPISVLLIDDHRLVRQGVRSFLSTQDDLVVVGEAGSGEEGIALAAQVVPDVALMDLVMPGIDGVEATRRLKDVSPHTQIVVLTSYHDDDHIFPALRAGALSYVLKDVGVDALADAIRSAAKGEATLHPRVASRVIQEMRSGGPDHNSPFAELTDRELDVLRLIADGLNNSDIADRLVVSQKTVKGHVSNILSKLHLADRTQAAVLAWREGLARRAGPHP